MSSPRKESLPQQGSGQSRPRDVFGSPRPLSPDLEHPTKTGFPSASEVKAFEAVDQDLSTFVAASELRELLSLPLDAVGVQESLKWCSESLLGQQCLHACWWDLKGTHWAA